MYPTYQVYISIFFVGWLCENIPRKRQEIYIHDCVTTNCSEFITFYTYTLENLSPFGSDLIVAYIKFFDKLKLNSEEVFLKREVSLY